MSPPEDKGGPIAAIFIIASVLIYFVLERGLNALTAIIAFLICAYLAIFFTSE